MAEATPPSTLATIIGTAIISLMTGYMLGMASSLGLVPNPFGANTTNTKNGVRRPVRTHMRSGSGIYAQSEESSEDDVEVDAVGVLDHAPNWSNGAEADKRQGLKIQGEVKRGADGETMGVSTKKVDGGKESTDTKGADLALGNGNEECKLILVVRTDLGMTKGKIAAQCGHATLACYKSLISAPKHSAGAKILRRWEQQGQAKIAVQVKSEEEMQELQAKALSLGLVAEVIQDAGRTQIEAGSRTVLGIGPAPKSVVDIVTGGLKLL